MQVIGLCRFSYPALGGFQTSHDTITEREAHLYQPDRIAERFATFECLTLPSLSAQTERDFICLVVIGQGMPQPLREKLEKLIGDDPRVRILALAPERHRPAMQRAINSVRDETRPCVQFRLDDDDAVATDFVAKLRGRAIEAQDLLDDYGTVGIDFNNGHLLRINRDGLEITDVSRTLLTAALGVVFARFDTRCVMNFGHHRLPETMPIRSFPDPEMFLRGLGQFNDSGATFSTRDDQFSDVSAEARDHLKLRYGVDCNLLSARMRLEAIRQN